MRAVVYGEYGGPEVLRLEDRPVPTIDPDEALVRVHAASVNSWDWDLVRGVPLASRIGAWRAPRYPILGADVAGTVEAVGSDVEGLSEGDEVLGDLSSCGWGGFAEFVSAKASVLAPKPASLSFDEAAAIPQAATLAWQSLRKARWPREGSRVLINGAGGGMGTFAVQMAAAAGAEVTGVDAAHKLDAVQSLGASRTIDYEVEDFTASGERYDAIIDAIATRPIRAYRRALRPGGRYVAAGGTSGRIVALFTVGRLASLGSDRKTGMLVHRPSPDDLMAITRLVEAGAVVPFVDRVYPLAETRGAIEQFASGRFTGKIVVGVSD
jgi:NADPH:quinone reductase-like Zn-dependent oxidoreductase